MSKTHSSMTVLFSLFEGLAAVKFEGRWGFVDK